MMSSWISCIVVCVTATSTKQEANEVSQSTPLSHDMRSSVVYQPSEIKSPNSTSETLLVSVYLSIHVDHVTHVAQDSSSTVTKA